jgi:ABC-type lipoprotein export system ATPase subunit
MKIDRLEVSGGFLDGLRLDFADGLNVLIGARGAGKTSVLELVRFALSIPAMTTDAERAAHEQALAVLGDGTVTVYTTIRGEQLILSRTGLDDAPAASSSYKYIPPLLVSQNEIEAIGLDPTSRRNILDRLIDPVAWSELETQEHRAEISSLERQLELLREERDEYREKISQGSELKDGLKAAEVEQKALTKTKDKAEPLEAEISTGADRLGQIRASGDAYKIAEEALAQWQKDVGAAKLERPLPSLPSAGIDAEVTNHVATAEEALKNAVAALKAAKKIVRDARTSVRSEQTALQDELKTKAEELEEIQVGAGEVGRRVSALRQQIKAQQGLEERESQLAREIKKLSKQRDKALDEAEARSEKRYRLRHDRATQTTAQFNGRIEVRVDKSGEYGAYEAALVDALQGSNLQYRVLAATLAKSVSPRELVSAVESSDAGQLAASAGISVDRALRLIAHLKEQSVAGLLLAPLDDSVDFALLDGKDYKVTGYLSMGQRCTVVLPLLLAEDRDSILLDQPEDHLDNAFIVDTLVEALRERTKSGQVIVATHNANVPVLGEATKVIVLASDGRQGFVQTQGALDDDDAVEAITNLMEGGREAFARRAAFYTEHPHARQ